jgi:hypothetical protein
MVFHIYQAGNVDYIPTSIAAIAMQTNPVRASLMLNPFEEWPELALGLELGAWP